MKRLKIQHHVRSIADKLNKRAEVLSPIQQKLGLFLFCISFCGISTYFILQVFISKMIPANSVFIQHVHPPAHIGKTHDLPIHSIISAADFKRVELIKKYLDSISIVDTGRYTAILQSSPHMLDSIALFEKIFSSQSKK